MDKISFLDVYTIYDHPKDFPDHFVVSIWKVIGTDPVRVQEIFMKDEDLEPIREKLFNMGLFCVGRSDIDDPIIVESWI